MTESQYVLVLTVTDNNEQHLDNLRIKLTKVLSKYSEIDKIIVMSKVFMLNGE